MMIWPKDRMTRFEVARIIGARSLQISLGAPLLIEEVIGEFDPVKLAEKEFKAIKVPMTIKRTMPSNEKVIIDIKNGIRNWLEEHYGELI